MPEHQPSPEASWLAENYAMLTSYDGQWIAVIGNEVVGSHPILVALNQSLEENGIPPEACLFARVVLDRLG